MPRPKSGIKWSTYAFVAERDLVKSFRKAVKAQGGSTSEIFSRCMRSYVKAAERKSKVAAKKESAD